MTQNTELYTVLGVTSDASAEEIRLAYRKLVKSHHPDAGGDEEVFKMLQRAYGVLSDPEKRAHYDSTGATQSAGDDPNHELGRVMQFLDSVVCAVMVEGDIFDRDPTQNLAKVCVGVIQDKFGELNDIVAAFRIKEKRIRRVVKRFRRKSQAPDYVQNILTQRLAQVRKHIASVKTDMATVRKALEIMQDYEFTPVRPKTDAQRRAPARKNVVRRDPLEQVLEQLLRS